ncbi:MAG: PQQ-binding-like beta-propeller repeat protein [Proteobacteria bacterium]|nr:PQQ-binding-like beta-propeller repeat protein [Pseudomonadota bacterium]HQR03452.1 PQQ-binding-like beta-propeller repeat protein [Rhodocyclaceae bacterium]
MAFSLNRSAALALFLLPTAAWAISETVTTTIGENIFKERCAVCHTQAEGRTPSRAQLGTHTPESVVEALTRGLMVEQAKGLSMDERRSLAFYLTGKKPREEAAADPMANACTGKPAPFKAGKSDWGIWGRDLDNTRYQSAPGLTAAEVPRLKLKWSFAYPSSMVYGQPTAAGDRIFVTSFSGQTFSLDADTGCTRWSYNTSAAARAGFTIAPLGAGRYGAFIGDDAAWVHALDAATGKLLWKVKVDPHPTSHVTGHPAFYKGVLYVAIASKEEGAAMNAEYPCCTFRGGITALDAKTGKILWKSYTVDEPKPFKDPQPGKAKFGPAGASIWSTPTIDEKAGVVYGTTGNSYTDDSVPASDAVVAFDLKTGALRWARQATPDDNYVVGCGFGYSKAGNNCPSPTGGDWDFGAPVILRTLPNGKRVLLASQKSGVIWGMDPDKKGEILWHRKVGQSSPAGGLIWGSAASPKAALVAYTGGLFPTPDAGPNGVAALDLATGEVIWNTTLPKPERCGWGTEKCVGVFMMPVSAMPGVTFAGSTDGHLRAYDDNGKIVWDMDTYGEYPGVNGVKAMGGSLAQGGAVIANGRVIVNSGYGRFIGKSGNALLVYTVDGK